MPLKWLTVLSSVNQTENAFCHAHLSSLPWRRKSSLSSRLFQGRSRSGHAEQRPCRYCIGSLTVAAGNKLVPAWAFSSVRGELCFYRLCLGRERRPNGYVAQCRVAHAREDSREEASRRDIHTYRYVRVTFLFFMLLSSVSLSSYLRGLFVNPSWLLRVREKSLG